MSKRIVLIICLLLCFSATVSAKAIWYPATGLTGGTDGTLDSIDGQILKDGDVAIVVMTAGTLFYILDDDSAATESSPDVIALDTNGGDKRWILCPAKQVTSTTTLLADKDADINTIGKYEGKPVYNITTDIVVYASGSGTTDKWKEADGTDEHTPT